MRALHRNMPVSHKLSQLGSKQAEDRMNWRMLDLNLLVVFDAVVQERSATRAAAKLNMTQPAISHALARLRTALRDDLFVRTPDGMEPTPFAERLVGPVRTALENLHTALDGAAPFDPETAERGFAVAMDNRAVVVLAAPLAAAVSEQAPHVQLDIRPSGTLKLLELLDRGELDLAVGGLAAPAEPSLEALSSTSTSVSNGSVRCSAAIASRQRMSSSRCCVFTTQ